MRREGFAVESAPPPPASSGTVSEAGARIRGAGRRTRSRRPAPRGPIVRVPYDPRRLEALVTYAEAHRPSPFVNLPVRRLLAELAPPTGVIELRAQGRTVFVAAVVDRCDNLHDAALLEVLGVDEDVPVAPLLAAAIPVADEVARAAGRRAVSLSLPVPLADEFDGHGWIVGEGSCVLERDLSPWPSPALPPDAAWEDLAAGGLREHFDAVRAAFVDDPGMMLPDFPTFAAAALAADPPTRVLRAGGVEVGFARVTIEPARIGYVANIGRVPGWRGAGLGGIVLAEALRVLAARGVARFRLGVTATNAPALALYTRAGFTVVETWRAWRRPVAAAEGGGP